MYFFPILGVTKRDEENIAKHKDMSYTWKEIVRQTNKPKMHGGNLGSNAIIYISDPLLIKEFLTNHEHYEKPDAFVGLLR